MGWVANGLLILSMWLVGSNNRWAFVAGPLGNFIYIFRGYENGMNDLIFIALVMVILNIRAWLRWKSANPYWDRMVRDGRRKQGRPF